MGVLAWLQLIIHNLFSFGIGQNKYIHGHVKYYTVVVNTAMSYAILLATFDEKYEILYIRFALVIDGWSERGT